MAWESRNGRGRYYTRSLRIGGRVVRLYIGCGAVAEEMAAIDAATKNRRATATVRRRNENDVLDEIDRMAEVFRVQVDAIYLASMTAAGYHRHDRGAWRKKRSVGNEGVTPVSGTNVYVLTQQAESALLERMCGGDPAAQATARAQCGRMRAELVTEASPPLERLLADRIVLCWLTLHYFETIYAQNMGNLDTVSSDFHQKRLDRAHRRYLSAVKALAQVRRLQIPAVQINLPPQPASMESHKTVDISCKMAEGEKNI